MSKNKKKGGPVTKKKKVQIIEQLKDIVESGQILGITDTQLAQQVGVTRVTLSKYLEEVYSSIPPEDIKEVQVKIDTMFKRIFREAQKLIKQAKDNKEKKEAMEFLIRCIREFTDFLERFGIKQKVADKHEIQGEIDITHNINYQEQRNRIDEIAKSLKNIKDEKKAQEIVIDLMDNETKD